MICMNTRGACNKEARYIKRINCSNFCSYECYLIYIGRKKPRVPKRKKFDDPERQHLHDLYLWALTGVDPRKSDVEPKERGVKLGSKRGPYKKRKQRKAKKYTKTCKGCGVTFTTDSKRKEFHSEACRRAYWRRKKKQKDDEDRRNRKY